MENYREVSGIGDSNALIRTCGEWSSFGCFASTSCMLSAIASRAASRMIFSTAAFIAISARSSRGRSSTLAGGFVIMSCSELRGSRKVLYSLYEDLLPSGKQRRQVLCLHCPKASKNHSKGDIEEENCEWNAQIAFARWPPALRGCNRIVVSIV